MIFEENVIKPSFFDTIQQRPTLKAKQKKQKLWMTEDEFFEEQNIPFDKIDQGQMLYSGIMCKQDGNTEINEYFFKLYDKYLVQYKMNNGPQSKPKIIGIISLLFVKVEHQDEINEEEDELPFFLFSRNKQFDILVPETTQQFAQWLEFFRARCIMSNFGKSYQNIKIIGKGSFAKVMLCQRNYDKKQFAVKTYDKKKIKASKNPDLAILGIQNEIKIMWQLNHKNIIKLHEVYEGEFHIYLVLDLLTGGELFTKLHSKDNYSEKDACLLIKNLLESLEYMHSQGIMHRDIKPENLILKNDQSETEIMLADFGLSEEFDKNKELIFKRCGTPGYVAPEILNNLNYDTQVDIFSAGIILYIILTGYAPFFGDHYQEILDKNKKCKICFDFDKIDLHLSPEGLDLLKSMLTPDPKYRLTAKQALQHNWFKKYLNFNDEAELKQLPLQNSKQLLKDQKQILKQTRPSNDRYSNNSNELIMNSPIILGETTEINSPFNAGSPHILASTPNTVTKDKVSFSDLYKEAMDKMIKPQEKQQEKIIKNKTNQVKTGQVKTSPMKDKNHLQNNFKKKS